MNKFLLILTLFYFTSQILFAQNTKISGTVTDTKKQPIPGVNIYIKDSYDGATSLDNGSFEFETQETGNLILIASIIGFDKVEHTFNANGTPIIFNAVLKESMNELNAVTITAGSFEASDSKKATVLKPLDIVTTASAGGDIQGAIKTLPGTQQIGESEGLFVRGGTGRETQTFIDGMLVNNPYFSSLPDIASRGRFSPFLFKGTIFSSGGYSAQYGQGLSGALILDTQDLPDRSAANFALSVVGLGGGFYQLNKAKDASWGADFNYTNLAPYFAIFKQNIKYPISPNYYGGSLYFRKLTPKKGLLKFYGYYNYGKSGIQKANIDSTSFSDQLKLSNNNLYTNLSYKQALKKRWNLQAGTSFSNNLDNIQTSILLPNKTPFYNANIRIQSNLAQAKVLLSKGVGKLSMLRLGAEYLYLQEKLNYNTTQNNFQDHLIAPFLESDVYLSNRIVARLGLRLEQSSILKQLNIAPRTSIAYKLNTDSQLSFAFGNYYQKPAKEYILNKQNLNYEKATHYILNYQKVNQFYTFRTEVFYKKYQQLIKTTPDTANTGNGFAQGIELFWRDKKTLKTLDYWLSYSFLNTQRNFANYPKAVQPSFAATHTATLVIKKFFPSLKLGVGATYSFATGRPYYNPQKPNSEFMSDKTKPFHNLGINANYLTTIKKAFTVFVLSITNVTGYQPVYGYRFSANGQNKVAIGPTAKQFVFMGMFVSWGIDRRQEVIDNQ